MAALGLAMPLGAPAQEPAPDPTQDASPRPVSLDALLKLPETPSAPRPEPEVGGATRREWQSRFGAARADVETAEARLAEARAQLEKLASGSESWQVSAPGAPAASNTETGPLSFGLRQEIRRSREEVERAEQALAELRIRANLAGVPAEWMGEDAAAP